MVLDSTVDFAVQFFLFLVLVFLASESALALQYSSSIEENRRRAASCVCSKSFVPHGDNQNVRIETKHSPLCGRFSPRFATDHNRRLLVL